MQAIRCSSGILGIGQGKILQVVQTHYSDSSFSLLYVLGGQEWATYHKLNTAITPSGHNSSNSYLVIPLKLTVGCDKYGHGNIYMSCYRGNTQNVCVKVMLVVIMIIVMSSSAYM